MQRLSAPDPQARGASRFDEWGLGDGGRTKRSGSLVLQSIVEEALEGEVSDVLGRERYERGEGEKASNLPVAAKAATRL